MDDMGSGNITEKEDRPEAHDANEVSRRDRDREWLHYSIFLFTDKSTIKSTRIYASLQITPSER